MKLILLSLFAAFSLCAQSAAVYDLSPADAAEGKRLYEQQQKAIKAFEDWKNAASKRLAKQVKTTGAVSVGPTSYVGPIFDFTPDFLHAILGGTGTAPGVPLANNYCFASPAATIGAIAQ